MAGEVVQPVVAKPNGAPKAAPQASSPSVQGAPPGEAAPDLASERAALQAERKAQELKMVRAQRKYADEMKGKEKSWGEKLSELERLKKEDAQFKLNKTAYLKAKLGDDWYDQIVNEKINGGAPTADVVAVELARMEEKFEKRLADKDAEREKELAANREQSVVNARRQVNAEAGSFWKSKSSEFPLVDGLGSPEQISAELARRVEAHYLATTKRDEDGRILMDGEIASLQKLAEMWEGSLVAIAEKAAQHAKYADRLKPKVAPKDVAQQLRRTLSNDLTGTTPAERPTSRTDDDRRQQALEARRKYLEAKTST